MSPFVVFPYYLAWHYTRAIREFFTIWGNFIWFTYHYFSITILFKTLFSPFKKLKEYSGNVLNPGSFFEALVVNTVMRFVGLLLRSIIISAGMLAVSIVILLGLVSFVIWLVIPFVIVFLLTTSFLGIFKQ